MLISAAGIALNGQGAPLVPPFHESIFEVASIILNIGGISNITTLGANLLGFDTGPGNVADTWIKQRETTHDKSGEWASSHSSRSSIEELRDDPFSKSPPKSTGREYFNLNGLKKSSTALKSSTREMFKPPFANSQH